MKKPIDTGIYSYEPIPLLSNTGKVWRYTKEGAQRLADKRAKASPIKNATGIVCDCGEYWRIQVAGQQEWNK